MARGLLYSFLGGNPGAFRTGCKYHIMNLLESFSIPTAPPSVLELAGPIANRPIAHLADGKRVQLISRHTPLIEDVDALVRDKYWTKLHANHDEARSLYAALFDDSKSPSLLACVALLGAAPTPFFLNNT
ncbi:MAG: hypothetical protein R3B54_00055 [Bdellovibrionota bacterium]